MSRQTLPKQSISDTVMQSIQSGTVTMRPRVYFSLLTVLAVLASVAAGTTIAYLISVLTFWLRIITADTMAYGARSRLSEALATFPWWLLVVAVVLGTAAIMLVRRQGRMYKHRTSTLVLVLVAASLLVGVGFSYLNIGHPYAQQHSPQHGRGYRHNQVVVK